MNKKALLTQGRLPEEDVTLPGVGVVRVRGLSRKEILELRELDEGFERHLISYGMTDPALTPEEVAEWQGAAPNDEITAVTDVILRLSGLGEGAQKSGVSGAGD